MLDNKDKLNNNEGGETLRVFEAFSGYGSQSMAIRNLGIKYEVVGISEIDKYAIASYEAIHGEVRNYGDISKIKVEDIPTHDLFTYSFPCTDISVAGKQEGLIEGSNTKSSLLWECKRIISHCKPKYLLMENVKNLIGKKHKDQFLLWCDYLEGLGYKNFYQVLNAKHFNIPQNRERVFMVSILDSEAEYTFPSPMPLNKKLKDVLETNVDKKYYLSKEIQDRFIQTKVDDGSNNIIGTTKPPQRTIGQRDLVYSKEGIMGTLVATDYKQPKQILDELKDVKIEQVGTLDIKGHDVIKRVYSVEGLSPTLNAMTGGNRQPKILEANKIEYNGKTVELPCVGASRGRNPLNPSDRTSGIHLEQRLEVNTDGVSNTITTVQKDNYVIEDDTVLIPQATKKGYIELKTPGIADLSYPNSKTRRGRVQEEGKVSPTLTASNQELCYIEKEVNSFKIRKLTPRECLRLMGVSDSDIDKMIGAKLSNTQLYKLAGNSIVVPVLEGIFRQLFMK